MVVKVGRRLLGLSRKKLHERIFVRERERDEALS